MYSSDYFLAIELNYFFWQWGSISTNEKAWYRLGGV